MNKNTQSEAQTALIQRLTHSEPRDERAWGEFVQEYAPEVYRWCRRKNLQDADAHDVTQQVLLKLSQKLHTFRLDPKNNFRSWLFTLTHHAWHDYIEARKRPGEGTGDETIHEQLESVEARQDFLQRIEQEFDSELLDQAITSVRERVDPTTWKAFELSVFDGIPYVEVARRVNKKVPTVYVARSKVQKMLQETLERLQEGNRESKGLW